MKILQSEKERQWRPAFGEHMHTSTGLATAEKSKPQCCGAENGPTLTMPLIGPWEAQGAEVSYSAAS